MTIATLTHAACGVVLPWRTCLALGCSTKPLSRALLINELVGTLCYKSKVDLLETTENHR